MAKQPAPPSKPVSSGDPASDAVRNALITIGRNVGILLLLVVLGYLGYMALWGSDPRRRMGDIESTIDAYNAFIQPYASPGGALPSANIVRDFLSFFDDDSRAFFEQNAEAMARDRLIVDPERFARLNRDGHRGEAMLFLAIRPPLAGIARILEKRPIDGNRTEVVVLDRSNRQHRLVFRQTAGRWVMEDLGGIRQQVRDHLIRAQK
jgi:hypothetical protein